LKREVGNGIATLEAQRPNLKKKRREMKTAAARKKEDSAGDKEPPCVKCGARKFLGLTSRVGLNYSHAAIPKLSLVRPKNVSFQSKN
jgi:hypothetical protein